VSAQLVSVNVGMPRTVDWRQRPVSTGIFKAPATGRVRLVRLNLAGDGQADLSVHGGVDKAVYVYPAEHYAFWRDELRLPDLAYGSFGENFTLSGLLEPDVHLGDRFRVGTAEVMVTQPRLPCYKLGVRFGRADMPKRFMASRRTGFYLRVLREGDVAAGDPMELVARDPRAVPVPEVTELYLDPAAQAARVQRVIDVPALPASWRDWFVERLRSLTPATP
jgi:MOSC domain-containing protein YiiM